jgi:hypothetical protein
VEAGVKQAGGKGNAEQVVADGPGQVLAHHAEGLAGQVERNATST